MIFKIVDKEAASLPMLYRLVLSHVFAPNETLRLDNIEYSPLERDRLMEQSLEDWGNKTAADRERNESIGFQDDAHDWEWDMTRSLAKMLIDAEKGLHDKTKFLIKEHKLDYRKIFRLKEAYTTEGILKAQAVYADYFRSHRAQEMGEL